MTLKSGSPRSKAPHRGAIIMLLLCCALVFADYGWLVGAASAATAPAHTAYYDQLASGFMRGQLALLEKPNPALLTLTDPYDPKQRAGMSYPLDVSLYGGKYYLYFGPVPALLLMIPKLLVPGSIGDQYLVFIFLCGMFVFQSLSIVMFWRRFYSGISSWLVAASVFTAGLIAPFSWVAGRPNVYSAATTGGQLFFLAGLYAAFHAVFRLAEDHHVSRASLALTGALWAGAIACRINLIVPIVWMAIMVSILLVISCGRANLLSEVVPAMSALALPLVIGLAALAWYDWARFGSVLETGITYQLAGTPLQKHGSEVYSPLYVLQNLYNYAWNAPGRRSYFPYLYSATGKAKSILRGLALPRLYHAERVTGLVYTSPFLVLGIVPAIGLLLPGPQDSAHTEHARIWRWLIIALYGAFACGLAFFMAFFWTAERYFVDFLPCLVLLGILGCWQLDSYLQQKPVLRGLYTLVLVSLMVISIVVSNLLALGTSPLQY